MKARWMPPMLRRHMRALLVAAGLMPRVLIGPDYLQRQVQRSWRKESRQLAWMGLRNGMSVLDLGCGPGDFARRLAAWLPDAKLTLLDANARNLEQALEKVQLLRAEEVAVVHARAETTGLASDSFDFVIARFVFQHLIDPDVVAREALRILKPGGRLVVIDVDDGMFGVVHPRIPGLRRLLQAFGDAQAQQGGNRLIARALPRLLGRAGFTALELDSVAVHSDEAGLAECFPQLDPIPLRALVNSGHLTEADFAEMRAAHQAFIAAGDPYAVILLFLACGEKPGA